jgi:tetratricopeptide (TPR) repeat protein
MSAKYLMLADSTPPCRIARWRQSERRVALAGRWLRVWVLLTLLWGLCARADSLTPGFEAANRLYEQGKFKEAAAGYEKLLNYGQVSAALYFNMGNAFFKSGQMGRAIIAYHAAEQLAPRDPDVRANLQFARNQVQGPTLAPTWWQRGLKKLTLTEWTVLATTVAWALLMLLALGQWRPTLRPLLQSYVIAAAICGIALGGALVAAMREGYYARNAIVVADEVTVRQGPLDESPSAFAAHDGAELVVLDQKDDWLQVSTDPRRIGWVHRDKVLLQGSTPTRKQL